MYIEFVFMDYIVFLINVILSFNWNCLFKSFI